MGVAERIEHFREMLVQHAPGWLPYREVDAAIGAIEEGLPEAVVDAKIQRGILGLVKSKLDEDPGQNKRFNKATNWKLLDQIVTAARLKELTRVKIVKKGGSGGVRYDVGELAESFYGRQVLDGLGFGQRRRVLDKKEYEKVESEFKKIKLTLPEAVEPTTTERFFAPETS